MRIAAQAVMQCLSSWLGKYIDSIHVLSISLSKLLKIEEFMVLVLEVNVVWKPKQHPTLPATSL